MEHDNNLTETFPSPFRRPWGRRPSLSQIPRNGMIVYVVVQTDFNELVHRPNIDVLAVCTNRDDAVNYVALRFVQNVVIYETVLNPTVHHFRRSSWDSNSGPSYFLNSIFFL